MLVNIALVPFALVMAQPVAPPRAADVEQQYERWERYLRARVTELHSFPGGAERDLSGDVVVSFAVGPDGFPADALIRRSSGKPIFDRAALRLVRLLGRIGPAPSVSGEEHRVTLKLSYGEAATVAADRQLTNALEVERQVHAQRNLRIVTGTSDRTTTASWQDPAR